MSGKKFRKSSFNKDFTAEEARKILMAEGGQISRKELIIQVAWTLALGVSLAWAIAVGKATVWHMVLPLIFEYLALLVSLPVISMFWPHPEINKERTKCIVMLGILAVGGATAVFVRANSAQQTFSTQAVHDWNWLYQWIFESQMHWPILVSLFHAERNLIRNTRFLIKHGPPFMGAGMGCAMRIAVVFFAVVLVPVIAIFGAQILKDIGIRWQPTLDAGTAAWIVFSLLLLAELGTHWFLWDVQSKLKAEGKLPDEERERAIRAD